MLRRPSSRPVEGPAYSARPWSSSGPSQKRPGSDTAQEPSQNPGGIWTFDIASTGPSRDRMHEPWGRPKPPRLRTLHGRAYTYAQGLEYLVGGTPQRTDRFDKRNWR